MKKILLFLMTMFCLGVNAQTAIETPKTFDNVYVGAQVGVSTPTSFNSTFPINTYAGVKVGKNLTPVFGLNLEGDVWFGSATNEQGRFSYKNAVRATNVGLNATIDMFNWIEGYNPNRVFSIIPEVGIGWLHTFNSGVSDANDLSSKTGVQFVWNIKNAWQLYVEPTVWWNITGGNELGFNKNYSQIGLQVGFVYKFKNSNGTHGFVTYNVGEMNDNINALHAKVTELENRKPDTIEVHDTLYITSYAAPYYVCFAQNSSELTPNAKSILDSIPTNVVVNIEATASPEGTEDYNKKLSSKRAEVVSEYLSSRGIKVESSEGIGVPDESSNRIAIITVSQ